MISIRISAGEKPPSVRGKIIALVIPILEPPRVDSNATGAISGKRGFFDIERFFATFRFLGMTFECLDKLRDFSGILKNIRVSFGFSHDQVVSNCERLGSTLR